MIGNVIRGALRLAQSSRRAAMPAVRSVMPSRLSRVAMETTDVARTALNAERVAMGFELQASKAASAYIAPIRAQVDDILGIMPSGPGKRVVGPSPSKPVSLQQHRDKMRAARIVAMDIEWSRFKYRKGQNPNISSLDSALDDVIPNAKAFDKQFDKFAKITTKSFGNPFVNTVGNVGFGAAGATRFTGKAAVAYKRYAVGSKPGVGVRANELFIDDTVYGAPKIGGALGGFTRGFEAVTRPGAGAKALRMPQSGVAANVGATVGKVAGIGTGVAYQAARYTAGGTVGLAKFGMKNAIPIMGIGGVAVTAGVIMSNQGSSMLTGTGAGHYAGNPLSASTYSGSGGQRRLMSQFRTITEQQMYNNSQLAGMGDTMGFTRGNTASPIPMLPAFQKSSGYSPEALSATGDLVFSLGNLRRG